MRKTTLHLGLWGFGLPWWFSGKESACNAERSLSQEALLVKEMATHSSTLAWEIPWTEMPGRLQSTESQRVRHDLVTKQQQQLWGFKPKSQR